MKVILTDEIRGLGARGDIVTVKDGYARNYLIPKNLAREATPGNLKGMTKDAELAQDCSRRHLSQPPVPKCSHIFR